MTPVGFEPTISADERPQNYALDRAATGTVPLWDNIKKYGTAQQATNDNINTAHALCIPGN